MGMGQSIYEKSGPLDYIKLSPEERNVIKNVWSGIEKNPQLHGTSFYVSFLEHNPQYIKFFTLDPHSPLNVDPRTNAKFTIIVEGMGYLLLDFHNKPKQLDRLVGYIAMVHKDMHLNNEDMLNLGHHLLEYLRETFPAQMTPLNHEIVKRYMLDILNKISMKMDLFRDYEISNPGIVTRSLQLPCGKCTLFSDNLIFGQTKVYWNQWKNQWNMRQNEWIAQMSASPTSGHGSSTDEDDNSAPKSKPEDSIKDLNELNQENPLTSSPYSKHEQLEVSASRLALVHLTRKLESARNSVSDLFENRQSTADDPPDGAPKFGTTRRSVFHSSYAEGMSPRERYRAQSLAREAFSPHGDATVLRRRIRTSRIIVGPTSSQVFDRKEEPEPPRATGGSRKFSNTARERRRETKQFGFDLQ